MVSEMYSLLVDSAERIINPLVRQVSPAVLKQVLDGGDAEHKEHGQHGYLLAKRIDGGHPVQQHYEYKVHIGDPVELFKQVLG